MTSRGTVSICGTLLMMSALHCRYSSAEGDSKPWYYFLRFLEHAKPLLMFKEQHHFTTLMSVQACVIFLLFSMQCTVRLNLCLHTVGQTSSQLDDVRVSKWWHSGGSYVGWIIPLTLNWNSTTISVNESSTGILSPKEFVYNGADFGLLSFGFDGAQRFGFLYEEQRSVRIVLLQELSEMTNVLRWCEDLFKWPGIQQKKKKKKKPRQLGVSFRNNLPWDI